MAKEKATLTKLMPDGPASVTIGGQAVGDASEWTVKWFVDDRSSVTMPLLLDDFRLQNIRESAKTLPAYFDIAFLLRLIDERDMIIRDLLMDKGDIPQTALSPLDTYAENRRLMKLNSELIGALVRIAEITRRRDTFAHLEDYTWDRFALVTEIADKALSREGVE